MLEPVLSPVFSSVIVRSNLFSIIGSNLMRSLVYN
nr:MAG TPA: hypothetical protein [Caudoviricetes sp.]